jgi:hypothetical protein
MYCPIKKVIRKITLVTSNVRKPGIMQEENLFNGLETYLTGIISKIQTHKPVF